MWTVLFVAKCYFTNRYITGHYTVEREIKLDFQIFVLIAV